ncbi:hypothetical protein [Priestia flexa]|uniref:hypothetical protein n=1 Tax=Priestia flexa TaxID=86664 RepID=UPI0006855BB5|nr:hypothetical protein [Priestia flexa]
MEVPNAEKEKEKTEEAPKKNPRGAGRKKGSTTTRKSTAAIKVMNKEDIKQLLIVTTSMFASKEGMEIWALTDKEADQLAEPLANILARNEAFSKVAGANGDAMALVLAAFLIFVPKFMMWNATRPKKRKKGEAIDYGTGTEHITNGKSAKQQKGKVNPVSESPSRQPVKPTQQPDGKNINSPIGLGNSLGGLIPSLNGI